MAGSAFDIQSFNLFDAFAFGRPGATGLDDFEMARAQAVMRDHKALGFNTVTLGWGIPIDATGRVASGFALDTVYQASAAEITALANYAKSIGLQVILKPQAQTLGGLAAANGGLPDNINSHVQQHIPTLNPKTFLASWVGEIAKAAALAQKIGAIQLVIGTENQGFDTAPYRGDWAAIIAAARANFSGQLSYDALYPLKVADTGVDKVAFWDLLDVIGVSAYYPLTNKADPTYSDILAGWYSNGIWPGNTSNQVNVVQTLHDLSRQYNKPVAFYEFGGQSFHGMANDPTGPGPAVKVPDWQQQAWVYQSMLEAFTTHNDGNWFLGITAFGNSISPSQEEAIFPQYLRAFPDNFDFRGKDAAKVLAAWFGGVNNVSAWVPDFVGTDFNDTIGLYRNTKVAHAIDGGQGLDTLKLNGSFSSYEIASAGTRYTIRDTTGADGVITVTNIERLTFADKHVALDIDGHAGMAYRLYQAAFNRKPDLGGLGFWITVMDHGAPLGAVADSFIGSAEFQSTYGSLNTAQFVTQLYANVLHRTPDAGGLDFWTASIDRYGSSRADVLAGFSESAENQANVIGSIQNGIVYTPS